MEKRCWKNILFMRFCSLLQNCIFFLNIYAKSHNGQIHFCGIFSGATPMQATWNHRTWHFLYPHSIIKRWSSGSEHKHHGFECLARWRRRTGFCWPNFRLKLFRITHPSASIVIAAIWRALCKPRVTENWKKNHFWKKHNSFDSIGSFYRLVSKLFRLRLPKSVTDCKLQS